MSLLEKDHVICPYILVAFVGRYYYTFGVPIPERSCGLPINFSSFGWEVLLFVWCSHSTSLAHVFSFLLLCNARTLAIKSSSDDEDDDDDFSVGG
jgi:hypothetical protein